MFLKDGAVIIADAHFNSNRLELLDFLKALIDKKIVTTQLLLLGDIFDVLIGEIDESIKFNKIAIDLLNQLSNEIEIIYFEGNHDFNLEKIFPNITILPLKLQPKEFLFNSKKLFLSHGDIFENRKYQLYSKIIRTHYVLIFIKLLNKITNNLIFSNLLRKLQKKSICEKFIDFEKHIYKKLKQFQKINADFIIEGHYHQEGEFEFGNIKYLNIASFACNKSFFIVKSNLDRDSVIIEARSFDVYKKG